jgi:hypothetical protein
MIEIDRGLTWQKSFAASEAHTYWVILEFRGKTPGGLFQPMPRKILLR